jgi:uncharacterized membrane protein
MNWNKIIRIFTIVLIFAAVYGFLIKTIPWNLVFLNTTISGGDTGSHNYVAWYSHEIFPKLKWWSPDWYAGFPFLYFYPPFLYYLTDILSFAIPFNVAFKIITLLGTFLLPLAIYLCLYFLDFEFPIPSLGAILSLAYLFLEKFSIYGGNLPSTLAGEFSYSFGFALFFIFIGLLFKNLKEKHLSPFLIVLLGLMAVVHPFSVIVAVLEGILMVIFSFINKSASQTLFYLLLVYGLAFFLSAFWSLPFVALMGYTSKMTWTATINSGDIFPPTLIPFEIFAFLSAVYAALKKDLRLIPILLVIAAALIPYLFLNHSSVWNTRFLPFILMSFLMVASYGLGSLFIEFSNLIKKIKIKKENRIIIASSLLTIIFATIFISVYLPKTITYIPFWLKWNYEGFEKKAYWSELEELFSYLKTLPYGRVMWEYRGEYDKFGTPRVLEDIPIWTGKPTFEGLLIESSVSGYFHFINQAETTKTPTAAIAGMEYPSFNFENGIKHLKLFGAQYFIAFTPEIKQLADKYLIKLKEVNEFAVYKIPDSEMVTLIPQIQLIPKNKHWLDQSISWYKNLDFSQFLVFYQNKKELDEIKNILQPSDLTSSNIEIKDIKRDSLVFTTSNLYQPHLVKISYFPGWKAIGAKGPYLVSPSFMMVIPTQNEVTLKFEYNLWDKIGIILSILGLMIVVSLIIQKPYRFVLFLKQKFLTPRD